MSPGASGLVGGIVGTGCPAGGWVGCDGGAGFCEGACWLSSLGMLLPAYRDEASIYHPATIPKQGLRLARPAHLRQDGA